MAKSSDISDNKQKKRPAHLFKPGQSGNPAGRPKGSLSIMGRIKQIWEEDPNRFEDYVEDILEDKMLRKELIQQIDGKPKESIELGGKDGGPLIVNLMQYGKTDD